MGGWNRFNRYLFHMVIWCFTVFMYCSNCLMRTGSSMIFYDTELGQCLRIYYIAFSWFGGIHRVYNTTKSDLHGMGNHSSKYISEQNSSYMKVLLKEEYEFYYFIQQRFQLLMQRINKSLGI